MVFRRRRRFGLVTANSSHFFLHLSQLQSFPSLLLIEPLHLQFEPASLLADSLVLQLLFLNQLNFVERLVVVLRGMLRRTPLGGGQRDCGKCRDASGVGGEASRQIGPGILRRWRLGNAGAIARRGDKRGHRRIATRRLLGPKAQLVHGGGDRNCTGPCSAGGFR
jgi:hypothetical protein